ncbi:MAG: hypothetical protein AB1499_08145, partial [Nitrospirota bacterium]
FISGLIFSLYPFNDSDSIVCSSSLIQQDLLKINNIYFIRSAKPRLRRKDVLSVLPCMVKLWKYTKEHLTKVSCHYLKQPRNSG